MYFPTSAARQLATVPALPNLPPEPVLQLCPSPRKSLFCTLTRNGVAVWRVRPSAVLGYLSRTPTSIIDHGENVDVQWSPDSTKLVISTSSSYLVLITVELTSEESAYEVPPLPPNAQRNFLPGPGEGIPLQSISLIFEGVIRVDGTLLSVSPRNNCIFFSTKSPPTIQKVPWPIETDSGPNDGGNAPADFGTWEIREEGFSWFVEPEAPIAQIHAARPSGLETWITADGRAYFVRLAENTPNPEATSPNATPNITDKSGPHIQTRYHWRGTCVHDFKTPKWVQKQRRLEDGEQPGEHHRTYDELRRATAVAINNKFSVVAFGTANGGLALTNFPSSEGVTPKSEPISVPNPYNRQTGEVSALEWSSDGYVLAVGWMHGWAIFSVGGRCLASGFGVDDHVDEDRFRDTFMYGVKSLFWASGNFELFVLAHPSPEKVDGQLFVIPFAKSATTGQHSPDNARYAFLQLDDRALVYRGADQPDLSVINPESDVWQHIKIPQSYLATNWPIKYSSISNDGRLIAIAGRRGLIHYSSTSGRWKLFEDERQEQAFAVKGGLLWFHHVLVAAVEVPGAHQLRLYSRDLELSNQNVLHREILNSSVVILSIVDNSLLVYTADNTLYHYLIVPTTETIKLHLCGSITFNGIITAPSAVRMLSWMIPPTQKQLGNPTDDLSSATVLMVVGGQLILLRPRKSADQEVRYDLQIFAERIEFCWIHLRGIGSLENSLWAFDGQSLRIWLNALAIESPGHNSEGAQDIQESVKIPLDFYPLSVLMDKGIIIGAEHEAVTRSNLSFVMFRHATSSHLFLHHILRFLLEAQQSREAVGFATHYKSLVYFAHALEILLHTVVELEPSQDNSDDPDALLRATVQFLDHFDVSLDVVVGCARKTELTRWRRLFDIVGNPKTLFEACLASRRLKTAGSYLLVLHNLEQLDDEAEDAVRLLKSAIEGKDWQLCRELLRFLHSMDDSGAALRNALSKTNLVDLPQEEEEDGIVSGSETTTSTSTDE